MSKDKLLIRAVRFAFAFVLLLWAIHFFFEFEEIPVYSFGVYPRTITGLKGIVLYPLFHGDFDHLFNNTFPIFFLMAGVWYFYYPVRWYIVIWAWLISGVCLWSAARPAFHIGASGLIYALGAFIFFSGVFRKSIPLMALALLVVLEYGGMVWGILPIKERISWEGHLYGMMAGFVLSWYFKNTELPRERKESPEERFDKIPDIIGEEWKTIQPNEETKE